MLSFFALMLLAAAGWVHFRFGPVSFEQIVANLPIGGGEGVGNNNLATEAALECIGLPLVIVGLVASGLRLRPGRLGCSFKTELESTSGRTTVFRVWSPDPVAFNRARADQFSVLPTTLDLLGFGLENGRAGLGVSFAAGYDVEGTALKLPADDYESIVSSPSSALYSEFWQEHS